MIHPGAEEIHITYAPHLIAGHTAILEPLQDRFGVSLHVLCRAQIEGVSHGVDIHVPEQRTHI